MSVLKEISLQLGKQSTRVVTYLIPALSGSDDSKRGQGYVAHFCLQSVLDGKQERHDTGIQGKVTFDPFTSFS